MLGGPEQYFDTSAFALQEIGFLGNFGRNAIRWPGMATLDFSLLKDIPVTAFGDSGTLQFRAEFFNILNRANFGSPNRTIFSGTAGSVPLGNAGRITDTDTTSRQIQFALRLQF